MEIKTRVLPADEAGVAEAAQLLRQGQLVALPTETVYGIAADARNGAAVRNIFVAKGRPQDNPLIVHVTGPEMLPGLVSEVPERAQLLMAAFCPGPLTIIMPRGPEVAAECCAGLDTVGIRMPSHPVARAVIEASGDRKSAAITMNLVARGGSVVFFGLYGMDYNLELNLFTLYWKDATLSAVCVPSGQFPAAIAMAGQLKLEEVISRELPFSKGIEAFREKSSGREAKVMLRFEQEGSIC